ncbi:MAG: hypothetical protein U9532_04080 ['Conium maculatum' witches'-broom phytoplasma]|nr:hypothetical protein ['Conium maculatum' witches'-broom phytoplasma]MEC4559311.1 hypothetical protein ['Conium maculatum' witches'-broom phytoplasma]
MKIQEIKINTQEEIIAFLKQEGLLIHGKQIYIEKMELFLKKTNFYLRSNKSLEGLFLQQPKKEALLENYIIDHSLESFLDYIAMRKPKKIYLFYKKSKIGKGV